MLCFSRSDAGLPQALTRISRFLSQHFSIFYFPSVEVILDTLTNTHSLAFDSENVFSSQFREVEAERRTGWESEGSKIKGKWRGAGEVGERGHPS